MPNVILLCGNAKHITGNIFQLTPERNFKTSATYFVIRQKVMTLTEPKLLQGL